MIYTILSFIYLIKRKLIKRPILFLLHISFIVILSGALITFFKGERGSVYLEKNKIITSFVNEDKNSVELPFLLKLDDFTVINYQGTNSAADYVASVSVFDIGNRTNIVDNGDRKSVV